MEKEKTILKYNNPRQQIKIKLSHEPVTNTYFVYQNNFKSRYKKLSAATFAFEDLVFQTFSNRLSLGERELEGKKWI